MNKQEFIKEWAIKCALTYKDAEEFFNAFVDTVESGLKKEGRVQFVGFGAFEIKNKKAKVGISALTGKSYTTKERCVPCFKVATGFKNKF